MARIQAGLPLNDHTIVLSAVGFAMALLTGHRHPAAGLASRRLRHTRHTPSHILAALYTSVLIPSLSIFWRLVGALRYRVWFFKEFLSVFSLQTKYRRGRSSL